MIKTCWKNLPLLLSFVPYVHFALLLDFHYHSVSGFITLIFLSLLLGIISKKQAYFIFIYRQYYIYCHFLFVLRQFLLNGGTFIIL